MIKTETTYTKKVFGEFAKYSIKSNWSMKVIYGCAVLLLAFATVILFLGNNITEGILFAILGFVFAICAPLMRVIINQNNKRNIGTVDEFEFYEDRFVVTAYDKKGTEISNASLLYSRLYKVKRHLGFGYIFVNKAVAYIVVKENFENEGEFNFVLDRIEQKIKENKHHKGATPLIYGGQNVTPATEEGQQDLGEPVPPPPTEEDIAAEEAKRKAEEEEAKRLEEEKAKEEAEKAAEEKPEGEEDSDGDDANADKDEDSNDDAEKTLNEEDLEENADKQNKEEVSVLEEKEEKVEKDVEIPVSTAQSLDENLIESNFAFNVKVEEEKEQEPKVENDENVVFAEPVGIASQDRDLIAAENPIIVADAQEEPVADAQEEPQIVEPVQPETVFADVEEKTAEKPAKKTTTRKSTTGTAKKTSTKKSTTAKKPAAKKTATKKSTTASSTAKKTTAKKTTAKKATAKKEGPTERKKRAVTRRKTVKKEEPEMVENNAVAQDVVLNQQPEIIENNAVAQDVVLNQQPEIVYDTQPVTFNYQAEPVVNPQPVEVSEPVTEQAIEDVNVNDLVNLVDEHEEVPVASEEEVSSQATIVEDLVQEEPTVKQPEFAEDFVPVMKPAVEPVQPIFDEEIKPTVAESNSDDEGDIDVGGLPEDI